jgi:hydroxypyruvate isomerase
VLKFSANLSFLYQDLAFLERFKAAGADGFPAVEYLGPYAEPKEKVAETLAANGLVQALFNTPSGDWAAGERGLGSLPDRVDEFRAGIATAIEYAAALDCPKVNVLAGLIKPSDDPGQREDTFVENLKYAAPRFADAGVQLLIEPINTRDIPGFFLTSSKQAERILERVGHDNLYIQYDIYHMQVMQGDLVPTYERLKDRIAHIQVADTPGRNEPGTGEINYRFVFASLDRLGYDGYVGCEYKPKAGAEGTSQGLGWMKELL